MDSGWAFLLTLLAVLAPLGLILAGIVRGAPCSPAVCASGILGVLFNGALSCILASALTGGAQWAVPAASAALSGGFCALLVGLRRQEGRAWEAVLDRQRERMEEIARSQEARCGGLQAQLEELRRLRHDLRHYLVAAEGLPERRAEAARAALARPAPAASALDAVIQHYMSLAEEAGIGTDIRLELEEPGDIATPDLCLIVGNLLENAVEGVLREGGGFIRMRSAGGPGWVSIVAGNTFSGVLRPEEGGYRSSKAVGRRGRGLESVRRLAERYGGRAKFTADGSMFTASVFLAKPQAAADPKGLSRGAEEAV